MTSLTFRIRDWLAYKLHPARFTRKHLWHVMLRNKPVDGFCGGCGYVFDTEAAAREWAAHLRSLPTTSAATVADQGMRTVYRVEGGR